ncbi:histidine kinase [Neptunitalea chrysea]|uniref:Histidine kinase n=1 Tax=Neptunitalea chrysea TaxID=1647581 RepID=A0A9W6B3I0_9FLAO|nr:2TM domain-containing protein [Neptunitalea chrysea]GLB51685.1 histidine kinase [Neptunitalea chrysea]
MEEYKEEAYFKAKKRVEEIKGFYWNLFSYIVVIPFLIFVNYMTYWEFKWFWFPMFGWGIGLTIHGFSIFYRGKFFGNEWENRKIQEFLEQEKNERTRYE